MVLELCRSLGKVAGCAAFDGDTARRRVAQGYRFIQYSWDIGLVQAGLQDGVLAVRGAPTASDDLGDGAEGPSACTTSDFHGGRAFVA